MKFILCICVVDRTTGDAYKYCSTFRVSSEQNLLPLKEALKEGNFALGVATDGDADRVGVCLDTGEWLSAQNTILLLVDYLKRVKQIPGGIVKTSSVSDKIRSIFESPQTPVYEVQVGFKYIADLMTTHPIPLAEKKAVIITPAQQLRCKVA